MKIIREPTVYLLGRQVLVENELKRFLSDHDFSHWTTESPADAQTLIEVAARNCYQSFKGGRPHSEHLTHLLEVGHGSCVEHAVWHFLITGVSRSLSHELVRHRHFSFSQLSQRYVDESVAEYVEPDIIAQDGDLHSIWQHAIEEVHDAYVRLSNKLAAKLSKSEEFACWGCFGTGVDHVVNADYPCVHCNGLGTRPDKRSELRKAARQAARSVLPNATETKIFVTMNARAARAFIEQRASRMADVEIRKLAVAILRVLQKEAPDLFKDYILTPLPDGTFQAETPYRKV